MVAVKAHFDGKVIVPDEAVDLPKDQPLIVQIELAKSLRKPKKKPKKQSALDWIAKHAVVDDPLPADLSYQLDHYLYGTPKKKPPKR